MSWLDALLDIFVSGGSSTASSEDYRENGFTAYKLAWLERRSSGASADRVLTDQLDLFDTFKNADGTPNYPQVLIAAWNDHLTPASVQKLLADY